jgi:hypothetical protein
MMYALYVSIISKNKASSYKKKQWRQPSKKKKRASPRNTYYFICLFYLIFLISSFCLVASTAFSCKNLFIFNMPIISSFLADSYLRAVDKVFSRYFYGSHYGGTLALGSRQTVQRTRDRVRSTEAAAARLLSRSRARVLSRAFPLHTRGVELRRFRFQEPSIEAALYGLLVAWRRLPVPRCRAVCAKTPWEYITTAHR